MLKTTEQKKKYIQETRMQNYQASLKLEGVNTSSIPTQQSTNFAKIQKVLAS